MTRDFARVKSSLRRRVNLGVANEALGRLAAASHVTASRRYSLEVVPDAPMAPAAPEDLYTETAFLWLESTSRWRVELEAPAAKYSILLVRNGKSYWSRDSVMGSRDLGLAGRQEPPSPPFAEMFRHGWADPLADRSERPTSATQDKVLVVRGPHPPFGELPAGADVYELRVDPQRDIVTGARAVVGRETAVSIEVVAVEFDPSFSDETFTAREPLAIQLQG